MNGDWAEVARALAGIDAAHAAGSAPIAINAVVQRGVNDHTLVDLARFGRRTGTSCASSSSWTSARSTAAMEHVVPAAEIIRRIDAVLLLELVPPNYPGEVARRYRFRDGSGEIGVIASVTQPFCGACTRLRLSPEGSLFTCLFAAVGTDLRAPLRAGASDDELAAIVRGLWRHRADRYPRSGPRSPSRASKSRNVPHRG